MLRESAHEPQRHYEHAVRIANAESAACGPTTAPRRSSSGGRFCHRQLGLPDKQQQQRVGAFLLVLQQAAAAQH